MARIFHLSNYKNMVKHNAHVVEYWQYLIDNLPADLQMSGLEYAELRQLILTEKGYNRQARENVLVKDLFKLINSI